MFRFNKVISGVIITLFMLMLSAHPAFASSDAGFELPDVISDNPVFEEPRESIEVAFDYIRRGDREFRLRPGRAQKYYEHAEDYLLKAAFLFKNIGIANSINVADEVAYCEKMQRDVHVKTSDARKKSRNR